MGLCYHKSVMSYTIPSSHFDENVAANRLGADLDIAIAIQNHELTPLERDTIVQQANQSDGFNKLSASDKDLFNQRLYRVWRVGRLGEEILESDEKVLDLVTEFNPIVQEEENTLQGKGEKNLLEITGYLVNLSADTHQKLLALLVDYLKKFSDFQNVMVSLVEDPNYVPGEHAADHYLKEYRQTRLEWMEESIAILRKLVFPE